MKKTASRTFTDFSEEEKWLGSMAEQGWMLVGITTVLGRYCFEQGKPYSWSYRIDYRNFKSFQDFNDYVQLFEDSGWHHVAGTRSSGSQYFVQVRPDGVDDIFSDTKSRANRYKRKSIMWFSLALVFMAMTASYITNGTFLAMLDPKALYLTPGLWDMAEVDFWRAFLFETPFAMGRGFLWLIFPAAAGIYIYLGLRMYFAGRKPKYPFTEVS